MNDNRFRLHTIDALRGLAAGAVVFYHLWFRYFPNLTTQEHPYAQPIHKSVWYYLAFPFQYGYFGVTLFFVLSGFCIHLPQALRHKNTGADRLSLPAFARRRFLRIYPAYLASIVWTSLVLSVLPLLAKTLNRQPADFVTIFRLRQVLMNATFTQFFNWRYAFEFNGVYWTLVYEVQFYAFYPLLLWAARRWNFFGVMAILFVAELACIATRPPTHACLFIDRYFEWYLGMFAAEMVVKGGDLTRGIRIGLPGLLLGLVATFVPYLWPWRDVFLSIGFFGLLLLAVRSETIPSSRRGLHGILHSKILISVGLSSYSLYLIHVPIIDICWLASHLAESRGVISSVWASILAALCIPISFMLAPWWYRLFEQPFIKSPSRGVLNSTTLIKPELLRTDADKVPPVA